MSHRISDFENEGGGGGGDGGAGSLLRKFQPQGGGGGGGGSDGGMMPRPIRERAPRLQNRQRSYQYLRGRDNNDRNDGQQDDDDAEEKWLHQYCADEMQSYHMETAILNHFSKDDNPDDDGYDSDGDLEPPVRPGDPDYMDLDSHEHVRRNDRGEYVFDHDAMFADGVQTAAREYGWTVQEPRPGQRPYVNFDDEDADPVTRSFEYEYYYRDVTDLDNPLNFRTSAPASDAILPLKPHGSDVDDWLYAVTNHPSKYASMEKRAKHADGKREPRPTFPRERKLPDAKFVERYRGYLFVSGLVPQWDDGTGEVKEFENDQMHKQTMEESVAKLFGVTSLDVWPATPTSAFVGFPTKLEAKTAMMKSASDDRFKVSHPVTLQNYESKEDEESTTDKEREFVAASPEGPASIVKVTGLPANVTSAELLQSMFPPGSRIEAMFGPLSNDDYCRVSSTTALIDLASADLVSKALKSKNIVHNASVVGETSIRVLRAKRERVFAGWVGKLRSYAASKLGHRLLVTGDVPPHEMFLSHHDMMHISGLPPGVTLDDLALFFQPFSAGRRDVFGSGHIVRCSQGIPTGCAYIGFELPGEIDQVKEMYQDGNAVIGGAEVTFRTVRDKLLRRGVRQGARPARPIEELRSDLYDWERHVDPKDIQELEDLGIEKGILDEVMMTLRHSNRTFAAADQAISGERLYQERQTGMHYRSAVRKYLKHLKSCVGTKEDPGLTYWAMFQPDQEMDFGLFDIEEKRIKDLRKKGV